MFKFNHVNFLKIQFCLLCCPPFSPQMVGTLLIAPPTWKLSVQVPSVPTVVVPGKPIENAMKSNLDKVIKLSILYQNGRSQVHLLNTAYRTWQIGFFCSTSLVSSLRVKAQVEGEVTAVVGDCQYVLLSVTVPPHVVIASIFNIYCCFIRASNRFYL